GATILLDGEPLGRSNATFAKVSEGTYKLILQLDGYQTVEKQIVIRAAQTQEEDITFKKLQGIARIESEPSGALVFVDNVPLGRTPTDVKREFGIGNIRVELEDYFSETREMSFSHHTSEHNFSLRPKQGKISILSTPTGATVYFDGKEVGKTPWLGQMVEGGQHSVRLSLDQFEDWSDRVEVRASKSVSLAPTLKAVQLRSTSLQLAESNLRGENPFKKIAPVGKWTAAGVSVVSWILYFSASSAADDAYERYRKSTDPTKVKAARQEASDYDESAASRKTFAILSGLVSVGFFALDWNNDQNSSASLQSTFQKGFLSIGIMPQFGMVDPPRYALSLRFN
ncbi:MAG: PEGA domain-containing protein, partial [Candidatus Sericytochromatia bacterium]|nr:PEGA domain-containing protein [Candidatus Sericytochromatia bacterium]